MHIVVNGWFTGRREAGSGQYIDHLLAYLTRLDAPPRITLALPDDRPAPAGIAVARPGLPGLPRNLAKVYWEQIIVPRVAAEAGADVLWAPYWAAPYRSPCPVVVTVHDLIPVLLPAYRGGLRQRLYWQLVRATTRRATQVIAVSAAARRDVIAQLGVAPERVQVVHHGPNQEDVPAPTPDDLARVQAQYGLPPRFFLYLGGFDVRKNVPAIVQAYDRYLDAGGDPAVGLVIAGTLPQTDSAFAPDPRPVAQQLGLEAQITFCGWVAEEDKPALYALATAYLFPSLYEGFGMMVLEAMAAGAPVITSAR